ncbi:hypothetical protein V8E36_008290 [Tilletia maclaganii]
MASIKQASSGSSKGKGKSKSTPALSKRLTTKEKKELLEHAAKHPSMSRKDMYAWVKEQFGKTISQPGISYYLGNKEKKEKILNSEFKHSDVRFSNRVGCWGDVDRHVYEFVLQAQEKLEISGSMLKEKAAKFHKILHPKGDAKKHTPEGWRVPDAGKVGIRVAIQLAVEAWAQVKTQTIVNCWRHCNIRGIREEAPDSDGMNTDSDEDSVVAVRPETSPSGEVIDQDAEGPLGESIQRLKLHNAVGIEELLNPPGENVVDEPKTEEDIVEMLKDNDEEDEPVFVEVIPDEPVSAIEALNAAKVLRQWLDETDKLSLPEVTHARQALKRVERGAYEVGFSDCPIHAAETQKFGLSVSKIWAPGLSELVLDTTSFPF